MGANDCRLALHKEEGSDRGKAGRPEPAQPGSDRPRDRVRDGLRGHTATQLKQELIPSLTIPTAVVYTTYAGASPQVVEQRVTVPVEQAVLGLSGLESSSSTSSTGVSAVTVNMAYGTNMSMVQQDLQAAISRIQGSGSGRSRGRRWPRSWP
jgi:hypothetical protein